MHEDRTQEGRHSLGDLGGDGTIMLKWIKDLRFERVDWIIWVRIG
jgi:hypothetical protein